MTPVTLPFDQFWTWLLIHLNCILRAGTTDAVLFDDEDLHWHFAVDSEQGYLVQLMRAKHLLGEFIIRSEQVTYCQGFVGETEGEFVFELVCETETESGSPYFFVMAHGMDEEPTPAPGRMH